MFIKLIRACLMSVCATAYAQPKQTARMEFPTIFGETIANYSVVPAGENGLAVFHAVRQFDKTYMEMSMLDTALSEIWSGRIAMPENNAVYLSKIRGGMLYILCKDVAKGVMDLNLLTINLSTQKYAWYAIRNFIPFAPTEFLGLGESVMIGGTYNLRPIVLHYSMVTNQSKILPGFFNDAGELLQLREGTGNVVDVVVSVKNNQRKRSISIRNFDFDGDLLRNVLLEPDADKNLIFGRSVDADGDQEVVAGVYGRNTDYARGVFVAHLELDGTYDISYYNFAELKHFFSYMRAKREKRIQERIERRKVKGKKIKFNYRFLVHDLIPYKGNYVMLGEAFYPQYRSTQNSGYANVRSARGDFVFDGYKYTHAVVIGFSKEGKLMWDNSFEINDVKTFNLEQFVKILPARDHVSLLYIFDNFIRTKIIQNDQVTEGKMADRILAKFETDRIETNLKARNKLEYWYPGHFFVYGIQLIINTQQPGVGIKRKVLFINKISDN